MELDLILRYNHVLNRFYLWSIPCSNYIACFIKTLALKQSRDGDMPVDHAIQMFAFAENDYYFLISYPYGC
jgi:hypothetical protein